MAKLNEEPDIHCCEGKGCQVPKLRYFHILIVMRKYPPLILEDCAAECILLSTSAAIYLSKFDLNVKTEYLPKEWNWEA